MDSCLDLEPAAPSSDAHAGGEPTAPAAPHDSPSPEAAAQQDEAVKHEEAECALEPAGAMMLASDDGGLVGASGQRISAAEIQLVQNLVERCLQARGKAQREQTPSNERTRAVRSSGPSLAQRAARLADAAARAARTPRGAPPGQSCAAATALSSDADTPLRT